MRFRISRSLLSLPLLCVIGCSGSSSEDNIDLSGSGSSNETSVSTSASVSYTSLCGVYQGQSLVNPATEGEPVNVDVFDPVTFAVTPSAAPTSGQRLIKLQGVTTDGVNEFRLRNGVAELRARLAAGALLVTPGESCEVIENGTPVGVLGQLFSLDGQNVTEFLLQLGAVVPTVDICGGDVLAACYSTIGFSARPPSDIELDPVAVSLTSQCGTVKNNAIVNPVSSAEEVIVDVVNVDEVLVTRLRGLEAGNTQAVKLQGITDAGVPAFRVALGRSLLASETAAGAYLVVADQACPATLSTGVAGVFGQLFSRSGTNLNEALIRSGSAVPAAEACGGQLLTPCYTALEVSSPDPGNEPASDQVISDFLWKPVSESDGRLVVLVNPVGVRILVSGAVTETLRDSGPSNGRGTSGRSTRPGCGFGNNIRVEFFDSAGNRIFVANGESSVTIPSGCNREEFRL